jgi:hypothetical protein
MMAGRREAGNEVLLASGLGRSETGAVGPESKERMVVAIGMRRDPGFDW